MSSDEGQVGRRRCEEILPRDKYFTVLRQFRSPIPFLAGHVHYQCVKWKWHPLMTKTDATLMCCSSNPVQPSKREWRPCTGTKMSGILWLAHWSDSAPQPTVTQRVTGYSLPDSDWDQVWDSVCRAIHMAHELSSCFVAHKLGEVWLVSIVRKNRPWITIAIDSSYDLIGNLAVGAEQWTIQFP
jgi:hypothetical protein